MAKVHCTDSVASVVASIRTSVDDDDDDQNTNHQNTNHQAPSFHLTKSVADLVDLSQFETNSVDVITCCYGYNLVEKSHLPTALKDAYRVLAPGGILIVANWEQSGLQYIGRDVLAAVRRGGAPLDEDHVFLPPIATVDAIALSSSSSSSADDTSFDASLKDAGFQSCSGPNQPASPIVRSYPFNLGHYPDLQFLMGTLTIRGELQDLGALRESEDAGGWSCLAAECFWTNIRKYVTTNNDDDGSMWLNGNVFKMTVVMKK
jgi:SAM-dependent methyltransferase